MSVLVFSVTLMKQKLVRKYCISHTLRGQKLEPRVWEISVFAGSYSCLHVFL